MKTLQEARFESPLGEILVLADGDALVGVEFLDAEPRVSELRQRLEKVHGPMEWVAKEDPAGAVGRLRRFFAGEVGALDGQWIRTAGSEFEERVWRALRTIPVGETWSYGELAKAIGSAGAARAVGAANGRNPVPLFVPCHRVIASDGSLHGYGGGMPRKRWLLDHEREHSGKAKAGQLALGLRGK